MNCSEKQGYFDASVDLMLTKLLNVAPYPTGDKSAILTDPGPLTFEGHERSGNEKINRGGFREPEENPRITK
jgi:hypothetical protein